jgi:hypothetical protein
MIFPETVLPGCEPAALKSFRENVLTKNPAGPVRFL